MTPVSMRCLEESWIASLTLCVRLRLHAIFLDLLRETILIPLRFAEASIELVWNDYLGYPEYPQRYPRFEHGMSIIDLLFNAGPNASWYIWGWREESKVPE